MHLAYDAIQNIATGEENTTTRAGFDPKSARLVLYPHFQQAMVPGWLDKPFKRRHGATPFLDSMLLLAPNPDWVRTLPGAKLPDRNDLQRLGHPERVRAWTTAVQAARQLADEFEAWLQRPDPARIQPL